MPEFNAPSRSISRSICAICRSMGIESLPQDVYDTGAVITFTKNFSSPTRVRREPSYLYCAIKGSNGQWYTSGPQSPGPYTWERLLQWLASTGDLESLCWAPFVEPIVT